MDTVKIGKNATRMIAHRGLSGIEPENTNAAFIGRETEVISELRRTFTERLTESSS